MAGDGGRRVVVPPTLQALLAARLDSSRPPSAACSSEARSRERSSNGARYRRSHPRRRQVTPHLAALVRKELIRPDKPQLAGEDGFRLRHCSSVTRPTTALPKATRADLHERFAPGWSSRDRARRAGRDPRLPPRAGLPLPRRARAARRRRADRGGTATPDGRRPPREPPPGLRRRREPARARRRARTAAEIDLALETELGDALIWTGRNDDALRRADALAERASAAGDRVDELCGRIQEGIIGIYLGTEGATEKLAALVEQALPVFETADDDLALYVAYSALAEVAETRARMDAGLEAFEQAFAHARRAGHLPPGYLAGAPPLASSERLQYRNCSRGSTRTTTEQGEITS